MDSIYNKNNNKKELDNFKSLDNSSCKIRYMWAVEKLLRWQTVLKCSQRWLDSQKYAMIWLGVGTISAINIEFNVIRKDFHAFEVNSFGSLVGAIFLEKLESMIVVSFKAD